MKLIVMAVSAMLMAGTAAWLVLFRNYCVLIWDVRHGKYKTPLMKQILIKYMNCREAELQIPDMAAFVEKNIDHYMVHGLKVCTWERLAKKMERCVIGVSVVPALIAWIFWDGAVVLYICATVGALSAISLHVCGKLTNAASLRRTLILETVACLENNGEFLGQSVRGNPLADKLTGKAALEFIRMNRRYAQIQAAAKEDAEP